MRFNAWTVEERHKKKKEYEESIQKILSNANQNKKQKQPKRLDYHTLKEKIVTDITEEYIVRDASKYLNRSYNQDKQIFGLIQHMFVKYPVPYFLYKVLRKDYSVRDQMNLDYILWFMALAQGQSFAKAVKPYMTSKEAHTFLSAPYDNINENVWWAKLKTADIPDGVIGKVIDRVFKNFSFAHKSERFAELITFYSHYHQEMDKITLDGVNDFVLWKLRNEPDFSFKGRTASSMIKLSNEWHDLMQRAKLGRYIAWDGIGIPEWMHVDKTIVWVMKELTDNKELANEGRKQKHCVFSYVGSCAAGHCNIFSLRGYIKNSASMDVLEPEYLKANEMFRVTVEMRNRRIVQIRGKLNSSAAQNEKQVLRLWAGEHGITIDKWA